MLIFKNLGDPAIDPARNFLISYYKEKGSKVGITKLEFFDALKKQNLSLSDSNFIKLINEFSYIVKGSYFVKTKI